MLASPTRNQVLGLCNYPGIHRTMFGLLCWNSCSQDARMSEGSIYIRLKDSLDFSRLTQNSSCRCILFVWITSLVLWIVILCRIFEVDWKCCKPAFSMFKKSIFWEGKAWICSFRKWSQPGPGIVDLDTFLECGFVLAIGLQNIAYKWTVLTILCRSMKHEWVVE